MLNFANRSQVAMKSKDFKPRTWTTERIICIYFEGEKYQRFCDYLRLKFWISRLEYLIDIFIVVVVVEIVEVLVIVVSVTIVIWKIRVVVSVIIIALLIVVLVLFKW